MKDNEKTKAQLITELEEMRQRVSKWEQNELKQNGMDVQESEERGALQRNAIVKLTLEENFTNVDLQQAFKRV